MSALVSIHASRPEHDTPPTLAGLMRSATDRLANAGIATPRLDAEILLRYTLGIDRTQLFLRLPEPVTDDIEARFDALIARRIAGEPVAYITGIREFMGLSFIVTPDVLIPRPETELLVEWALSMIGSGDRVKVVDIGTGSGAISISVAAHADRAADVSVIGTDISAGALSVAERNGVRLHPWHPVTFVQGSLGEPIRESVDLVLANLPYLTPEQIAANPDLDAEPRGALNGGAGGLDLVDALIRDLPRILTPTGAAGFELDPAQCQPVRSALEEAFPDHDVQIISDLAGRERHVVMRRGSSATSFRKPGMLVAGHKEPH